ncbi:hypothetical protein ACFPRL_05975 [Pseudoclavibacter helvolus]
MTATSGCSPATATSSRSSATRPRSSARSSQCFVRSEPLPGAETTDAQERRAHRARRSCVSRVQSIRAWSARDGEGFEESELVGVYARLEPCAGLLVVELEHRAALM